MECQICGGAKFRASADAQCGEPRFLRSRGVGKSSIQVSMKFTCLRCKQEYTGTWSGSVACPIDKSSQKPFPDQIIAQARREYGEGWDARHEGRRIRDGTVAQNAGWKAADQWAADKRGRPPVRGDWARPVIGYLETEEAWMYMTQLTNDFLLSSYGSSTKST